MITTKKLIEVALPLEAINKASAREKSIRQGHPNTLHLWWARRPLAAARAVIFAQMVDDPSSHPDIFPTEKKQEKERQRLFKLLEELIQWENTTNEDVLRRARDEIWSSWREACATNVDHPRAKELFDRKRLPAFHDPFAGGGALPLEAQRLGLESHASDLNPVAVLINKAMIEIPPKFAGNPPVNPAWHAKSTHEQAANPWHGAQGLAEDVRYYGQWMRDEAEKRIGHLYPKVEVTAEMASERPDLKPFVGKRLTVIAWIWARTVKSPNPAFASVDVPLASSFMLSAKPGRETFVEPIIQGSSYSFVVRVGTPQDLEKLKLGTRAGKAQDFLCLMSGVPVPRSYIRDEGKAGRLGTRLMAVAAEGPHGRIYLSPTEAMEAVARCDRESALIEDARATFLSGTLPNRAMITGGVCSAYGLSTWGQLFSPRQLVALTTFCDLVQEARALVKRDAAACGRTEDPPSSISDDGSDLSYSDSVAIFLGCAVSRMANYSATLCVWSSHPKDELAKQVFLRQALPMTWDFAETNPFSSAGGTLDTNIAYLTKAIIPLPAFGIGSAKQADARRVRVSGRVVSTDPPYFDNISYAELSDFFYAWLRRALKPVLPQLFATLTVPKSEELIATPQRHGGKDLAEAFFVDGMTQAMRALAVEAHPAFPVTIYYAFKQSETKDEGGTASTGWETFLDAVFKAGLSVGGTWPIRTELVGNLKKNVSALASSIVLVCRPRDVNAPTVTRRDFLTALKAELPSALAYLQKANIAPVDLAQAAIGPGMAVYTRYAGVLDAEGKPVSVREALTLINQTLDEVLAEQEGDFDADSRWALAWFEQYGFDGGEYGVAETLSRAKNTSVGGLVDGGILQSKGSKVRLLKPAELPPDWDPNSDKRLTVWEMVHHLIRVLEGEGEAAAAKLVTKLGGKAEIGRELAYRLYALCERKKRAPLAGSYNGLVQSWPELTRLAREPATPSTPQTDLFAPK